MRIVLCYPVEARHLRQIEAAAPDATVVDAGQAGIAAELASADIFCGHAKVPVDWPAAVAAGNLKWIQSSAAGMDHCLVPSVIDSDITVTSASGLFANQVAEQTMALLLGIVRSMPVFFRAQQAHQFERLPTGDLQGKTVGIVGFGGNGRRLAQVLAPFDVRIVATDRYPLDCPAHVSELWPADELRRLCQVSDIVVLCVPLNDETRQFFNAKMFDSMKPGSIFINVARGQVVDETALIASLRSKHLGAAGLDVVETEPLPTESLLWDMPNVVITPHVGAQAATRVDDSTALFCQNLRNYLAGKPLKNVVDKQLGFPTPTSRQD
jgi:D-3-phosphoglycerate dehydrogenase